MFTNTYLPHVGGVARAIRTTRDVLHARGHRVVIVAPSYNAASDDEEDIIRVPAVDATDGFVLPAAFPQLATILFPVATGADVIHVHHPNLLGQIGLGIARRLRKPIIFTYHTMYEHYAHLLPTDRTTTASVLVHQAVEFCNSCHVILAPSTDVEKILRSRGARKLIVTLPTGIDTTRFATGNGEAMRRRYGLTGPVTGYVGRLSREKNLDTLAAAARHWRNPLLVVGDGPEYVNLAVLPNVVLTGSLAGQALVDAYHAMDVFAFPSVSETQGLVLVEALAAGVPVCAINSPGVNDIVRDRVNGRLVGSATEFVEAIPDAARYRDGAYPSVLPYDIAVFGERLEKVYRAVSRLCR